MPRSGNIDAPLDHRLDDPGASRIRAPCDLVWPRRDCDRRHPTTSHASTRPGSFGLPQQVCPPPARVSIVAVFSLRVIKQSPLRARLGRSRRTVVVVAPERVTWFLADRTADVAERAIKEQPHVMSEEPA
jgi:hypothetical protein